MEPKKIKNIAFDLGGVVLALSLEGGIKGFERIGLKDARQRLDAFVQKGVFADLEAGRITKEEFRAEMCRMTGREVSMQECYEAWHGYADYVPQRNLDCIMRLRENGYKVCLLSNTNPFQATPEETLFVDDGEVNIKTAQALGMQTLCPHDNEDWTQFPEIKLLCEKID